MIKRAATQFDWEKAFSNLCIDSKIETFNDVLVNIFSNFCPSKIITCNDNDPPWLTDKIKRMTQDKDEAYRRLKLNNEDVFQSTFFKGLTQELTDEIEREKNQYYENLSNKLNNPLTSQKKYWTLLKTLMNGKKAPLIPPLCINNTFITDFSKKAELFNDYFADQ